VADQLATRAQLAAALQKDVASLNTATADVWLNAATAVVQEAAGFQRILRVTDEQITLTGTTDSWLRLPQIPVVSVSAVTLDGEALTAGAAGSGGSTYRLRGTRLWRGDGWQKYCGEPSEASVTYTHGYADTAQGIELARGTVISLARIPYDNPTAVAREQIDDYQVAYGVVSAAMEASKFLRRALRRQYGHRAGLVGI
jgi:hypothetical protein